MARTIRELVDRFYEIVNTGDGDFAEIFVDDFKLGIMRGFPYGGDHDSLAATRKFFADFGAHFDGWAVDTDRFIEVDDKTIIVTGRYRSRAVATGRPFEMETVHIWTARDGMLATYKHYCDTAIICDAMNHEVPQY